MSATYLLACMKGLYFTTVVLSFFRCLISEVAERISTKLRHLFIYDCYLTKFGPNSPRAFTPTGWGTKKGPTLNLDQSYLCNGTWYQQSERNLSIYRDSPTCPPKLVNVCPEMAENGWRVFAHPLNFHIERLLALPHGHYITDSRRTLARVCSVARAYSLEQQNARRAHTGLCNVSCCD